MLQHIRAADGLAELMQARFPPVAASQLDRVAQGGVACVEVDVRERGNLVVNVMRLHGHRRYHIYLTVPLAPET